MNRLERAVYDFVKNNPVLKLKIVRAYQLVCGLVPQKSLRSVHPIITRQGYFFGFHDKTPFSLDNTSLLAHRPLIDNRSVRPGDRAEVGFFAGEDWQDFRRLGDTTAWDWQLGSMLQWRGKRTGELVFNDIVDGRIGARILDMEGTLLSQLPRPVVHVSPCGSWASTYCFRRVGKALPGYGVRIAGDDERPREGFTVPDSPDFAVFSLADGSTRFSIGLDAIQAIAPHPSMSGSLHFFHHSLFSPSGTRLFFFHRWLDRTGRYWTRIFACNAADGSNLVLLATHEMVSHVGWIDDDRLLAYARTRAGGDGYYLLPANGEQAEPVAAHAFTSDGHPMWSPKGSAFVTDSYPDRFRNQYLYQYDMDTHTATTILRTHLGRAFLNDLQVDLHPRFDRSGEVICFDSGHPGVRSLCTVAMPRAETAR